MLKALTNRSASSAQIGLITLLLAGAASSARAESEWLAVCSKCVNPTILSKSGIGTASAKAEARIPRVVWRDARDHTGVAPGD